MTRFLPKSLFGQTLLILLFGLVVSHAIGAWIYAGAREQAVRAIGGFAAAQRVANLSRLVEEAPADWRTRIVQALSDPTFHVAFWPSRRNNRQPTPKAPPRRSRIMCASSFPSGRTAKCGPRSWRRRPAAGAPSARHSIIGHSGPMGGTGGMGGMMQA